MTNRKEYTFLEAMELVKAGEIVESSKNFKYKLDAGFVRCKLQSQETYTNWGIDYEEIRSPWFKVEKEKPKKTITIYEHEYWSHDVKKYYQFQTKKKWEELHNIHSGSVEHLSTKVLKTIEVEDREAL